MQCTDCLEKLRVRVYEGTLVQECPRCRGFFIEHETLARIAREELEPRSDEERQAAADAALGRSYVGDASTVSARRCSACGELMQRYPYAFSSGVIVDGCSTHGIWLDLGELERIEAWAEADRRGMIRAAARVAGGDGR
jgi:Zn-finger nucleic acid-binding protein